MELYTPSVLRPRPGCCRRLFGFARPPFDSLRAGSPVYPTDSLWNLRGVGTKTKREAAPRSSRFPHFCRVVLKAQVIPFASPWPVTSAKFTPSRLSLWPVAQSDRCFARSISRARLLNPLAEIDFPLLSERAGSRPARATVLEASLCFACDSDLRICNPIKYACCEPEQVNHGPLKVGSSACHEPAQDLQSKRQHGHP